MYIGMYEPIPIVSMTESEKIKPIELSWIISIVVDDFMSSYLIFARTYSRG